MMMKKAEPLTKADFIEFAQSTGATLETLKVAMESFKDELGGVKSDLGAVKTEMATRFEKVDLDIRRLMSASLATSDRITLVESNLSRRMGEQEARITTKLDTAWARIETLWRETTLYPPILDKQGARLEDHERRLKALETR